jgi:hypothetical protein
MNASALQGLTILSPSIMRIAMATKAAMELEVLEIVDADLLKCKRGCLQEVHHLEEALELQNDLFRGTFKLGVDALYRRKDATAALREAQGRGESPTVIQTLHGAEQSSESDLKHLTN